MTPFIPKYAMFQPGKILVTIEPMPIRLRVSLSCNENCNGECGEVCPIIQANKIKLKDYDEKYRDWLASFTIEVDQEQDKEFIFNKLCKEYSLLSGSTEFGKPYAIEGVEGEIIDRPKQIFNSPNSRLMNNKIARLKKPTEQEEQKEKSILEGWEKEWEEVNHQIKEGVNPHAFRLGWLYGKKSAPSVKGETDQNQLWIEAIRLYNLKEHTQDGRDLIMKNFTINRK